MEQPMLKTDTPTNHTYPVLIIISRAIFFISLPFGILGFVLPIYGKEIGADAVQIGLFFSAFSLMIVLLRPIVGRALDHFGRRWFFISGLVGYGVTMFAFSFSSRVEGIMLARVLQGIASSFLWLSARAITADVAKEDTRGRSFGKVDQASSQGAFLGTFLGFAFLLWFGVQRGWNITFITFGCISLGSAVFAWHLLPETKPNVNITNNSPIIWSRSWILLLLVTLVTGAAWAMISPILMIFLQEKFSAHFTELATAYIPAAIVWAIFPTHLGKLADRFGRKPLMVLGLVVAAIGSFFIPNLRSLVGLAVLWALQALCYAAGDPAEQALVADLTDGNQRGRAYGLYTLAAGIGMTIGPFFGGWLYENVNQATPFYANGVVLALCTLVLAIWLQEPQTTTRNDE
jgi:MFS family permease